MRAHTLRQNTLAAARALNAFTAQIDAIEKDPELTPPAKARRVSELRERLHAEVERRRPAQHSLVDAAEREAKARSPQSQQWGAALREPERAAALLTLMRSLPPAELVALVEHAAGHEPDTLLAYAARLAAAAHAAALGDTERDALGRSIAALSQTPESAKAAAEALVARAELARFEALAEPDPSRALTAYRTATGNLPQADVEAAYAVVGLPISLPTSEE